MAKCTILKVYNKDNKLKFLFRDTDITKTVSIYKYSGENIDTHSFTCPKEGELRFWQAYYEFQNEIDGGIKETALISKDTIEEWEVLDGMAVVSTTTKLNSGNVYKKKKKYHEGELYEVEFKNDKLSGLNFRIKENKINEYLKKLKNGK